MFAWIDIYPLTSFVYAWSDMTYLHISERIFEEELSGPTRTINKPAKSLDSLCLLCKIITDQK